jgi:broad-specificity NMP kinase
MRKRLLQKIESSNARKIIIDGHYGPSVVPKALVARAFVIRREPTELRRLMEKRHFSTDKAQENLASEILDVCLFEALGALGSGRVCEIDATGKSTEAVVGEMLSILDGREKCRVGVVDWLGRLESQGILDEFIKS